VRYPHFLICYINDRNLYSAMQNTKYPSHWIFLHYTCTSRKVLYSKDEPFWSALHWWFECYNTCTLWMTRYWCMYADSHRCRTDTRSSPHRCCWRTRVRFADWILKFHQRSFHAETFKGSVAWDCLFSHSNPFLKVI
jgi:hypothetical protein